MPEQVGPKTQAAAVRAKYGKRASQGQLNLVDLIRLERAFLAAQASLAALTEGMVELGITVQNAAASAAAERLIRATEALARPKERKPDEHEQE